MKISIITTSYNSGATIEKTIQSVIAQKNVDLEYIIIDGVSKDKTLEIIDKYRDKISKIISEKDGGIYDAMNKGIKLASGEIIGILNSDDFFHNDTVLSDVVTAFMADDVDACYGDIAYFKDDKYDHITRYWRAGEFKFYRLKNGWAMPHPALFVKKSIYDSYGLFRTDMIMAADYEFMLRLLYVHKIRVKYIPQILTMMREGGISGKNIKHRIKGWSELKKAWTLNNLPVPFCFIFRRVFLKSTQLFQKPR